MNPFFDIAIGNHQRGNYDIAASAYWGGIRNQHDDVAGLLGLAQLLVAEGNLQAAEVLLRRVGKLLGKEMPHVRLGLAIIAAKLGRYEEAESLFRLILATNPGQGDAWQYLGVIRQNAGATEDAIGCYKRAVEAGNPVAKICLAQAYFELGRFGSGIELYQARWELGQAVRPPVALHIPPWKGQPLEGRHVVVYEEQGFGDTIQLFRYIPALEAEGAIVTVLARREMQPLLQGNWAGRVDLIECSIPEADYSLPMFDLLGFSSVMDGTAYLEADEHASPRITRPHDAKKAIGIVWAGDSRHNNDRNRSVPLAQIARLASIPGVALYSLQMGEPRKELETSGFGSFVEDVSVNIRDFADTAVILKGLDLVVAADTAIVHLCGALGVPCFALIPYERDWRWGASGETTPWYDSVRLFRQQTPGDWRPVMDDVLNAVSL